jgi:hypothetical protein
MTAESITRVLAYLEGRPLMLGIDQKEIHTIWVNREDEPRQLLVADLVDIVRRAILVDSLDAEITRLCEIIREQRVELDKRDDVVRPECDHLAVAADYASKAAAGVPGYGETRADF